MLYYVDIEGRKYKIAIIKNGTEIQASADGRPLNLRSFLINRNRAVSFHLDGKYYQLEIAKNGNEYFCWSGSKLFKVKVINEKTAKFSRTADNQTIGRKSELLTAPMPGLIIKVEVEPGQAVKKGRV